LILLETTHIFFNGGDVKQQLIFSVEICQLDFEERRDIVFMLNTQFRVGNTTMKYAISCREGLTIIFPNVDIIHVPSQCILYIPT
jgi:hypothetical protein